LKVPFDDFHFGNNIDAEHIEEALGDIVTAPAQYADGIVLIRRDGSFLTSDRSSDEEDNDVVKKGEEEDTAAAAAALPFVVFLVVFFIILSQQPYYNKPQHS